MRIAIDASRAAVAQRTGTESYSLHIIRGLIKQGSAHRFRLYFRDNPPDGLFSSASHVEINVIRRPRLWTHLGLGPDIRLRPADVLFVPAHVIPWPDTGRTPAVVTVHDVGYLRYPQAHPAAQRMILDWSTRHSARAARRVIAVSQATACDLIALNAVPESKIRVIHSGIDETLKPVDNLPEIVAMRDRYRIPGPYVLHVGSLHARKNLVRLVEAFAGIAPLFPDLHLVLAGRPGWSFDNLSRRVEQLHLAERVIFPGYVIDADLPALYSGARAYALPSLYEGFGFPALEAMACGVPVVCSNTSSLPEIAGDAAVLFSPEDVSGMADALIRVLTDETLRAEMVARGFERVKCFSWESAARDTLRVLEESAEI